MKSFNNYNTQIIIEGYGSKIYGKVQTIKDLLTDLTNGNMEVYENWLKSDLDYEPVNFKVKGIQLNDDMEAKTITIVVDDTYGF